jgi:hypothetical protein
MMNRRVANPHLYLVNATCLPTKKDLFTFESATSSISMNRWQRLGQSASSLRSLLLFLNLSWRKTEAVGGQNFCEVFSLPGCGAILRNEEAAVSSQFLALSGSKLLVTCC